MFKVVFVIIGTLIGAGFASGQEIYSFFGIYGFNGLLGIIISSLLMGIIIYKTLKIIKYNDISTYKDFLERILGEKISKNKYLKNSILCIVNIFLLISFFIMVAGFAAFFKQEIGISTIYGAILISVLLLITFSKNINGVIKINNLLIPILIISFLILGIKKTESIETISISYNLKWLFSSMLYASYNSIVLIPILIDLKKYIINEKKISLITGMLISILSIIIYYILYSNINFIQNVEIPIVHIAGTLGNISKIVYGIMVLVAIFTSAVSAGYSFLINISKNSKRYRINSFIICLAGILVSNIGFSNLINILYPLFGMLGMIQIIFLAKT